MMTGAGFGCGAGRLRFTTVTRRPLLSIKVLAGSRLPVDRVLSFKIGRDLVTGLGVGAKAR